MYQYQSNGWTLYKHCIPYILQCLGQTKSLLNNDKFCLTTLFIWVRVLGFHCIHGNSPWLSINLPDTTQISLSLIWVTKALKCKRLGSLLFYSLKFIPDKDRLRQVIVLNQMLTVHISHNTPYYMEESVLLGTKPFVDSIRHFIRDLSGVFFVCHLSECRIVQWYHDSHLLLLLNWFLHIIKKTLHVGSKIWILCSRGENNISRVSFVRYCSCHSKHKIHIFSPPCNILYI